MDVATGAMGALLATLRDLLKEETGNLLKEEYKLQMGARQDIQFLETELTSMHAALRKVAEVPRDQLDVQVKIWAGEVRELSYKMADVVDTFLIREPTANLEGFWGLMQKMMDLFKWGKTRHQVVHAIKDLKNQLEAVADRRKRYKVDAVVVKPAAATTVDPRLRALYTEATELVGVAGKRDQELIKLLSEGDDVVSDNKLKTISVVGFGGLGKTTLVKVVYDKIKGRFDCSAFVSVGRNADVKKVFMDILHDLGRTEIRELDERQLINKLREFLENKRYLIVIDDIWDEKLWGFIKCAFSNGNNLGSRLITTTRIVSVSKACCSSSTDPVYPMEPLSDEDSRRLFNRRIFQSETECPPELQEVSRGILKKCGGVPLAIITIASLLASDQRIKPNHEWHVLLKSIGRGLTEDASVEEMQRILLFSYYDLPSHLKTCLLYLSVFPEDYRIERDCLIWKWIAESFIQHDGQESSMFELGETYFNELINRSMIQPIYNNLGRIEACCVHDMVLDLICSLSSEENFVTVWDHVKDSGASQSNIRRLSLQDRKKDRQTTSLASMGTPQVRSITIFSRAIDLMPPLSSFDVLRVLDLSRCDLRESQLNLRDIGKLIHLRYLCLAYTRIRELPAEIGNLRFLLVLDLSFNVDLEELPSSVSMLTRLTCLNCDHVRLPHGLENLASMEVLKGIIAPLSILRELRKMEKLRELTVWLDRWGLDLTEALVESLHHMPNIQSLVIRGLVTTDFLAKGWVAPRHLRIFKVPGRISTLPTWIKRNPSHLLDLSELSICVDEVQQEDLRILGSLPALCSLELYSLHQTQRLLVIGADGFRCVIAFSCKLRSQIMFERGALPRAERVSFDFRLRVVKEDGNGDFDLGLVNLLSLRQVDVDIHCDGVTVGEAKEAEAALRHVADVHPNHPHISTSMRPRIPEGAADDDVMSYPSCC